jgi:hypothetical protein
MNVWVHIPLDEFDAMRARLAKLEVENDRMVQAFVNIWELHAEAEDEGKPIDAQAMADLAWDAQFEGGQQPPSKLLQAMMAAENRDANGTGERPG